MCMVGGDLRSNMIMRNKISASFSPALCTHPSLRKTPSPSGNMNCSYEILLYRFTCTISLYKSLYVCCTRPLSQSGSQPYADGAHTLGSFAMNLLHGSGHHREEPQPLSRLIIWEGKGFGHHCRLTGRKWLPEERVVDREPPWEEPRLFDTANLRLLHREVSRVINTPDLFLLPSSNFLSGQPIGWPQPELGTTGTHWWNPHQSAAQGWQVGEACGMELRWYWKLFSFPPVKAGKGSPSPFISQSTFPKLLGLYIVCTEHLPAKPSLLNYIRRVRQIFHIYRRDHNFTIMTALSPEITSEGLGPAWKGRIFH